MREKEWYRKNTEEKMMTVIGVSLYAIWCAVSRPVYWICRGLLRLSTDVSKTIYGKVVAAIAAVGFTIIVATFFGLLGH